MTLVASDAEGREDRSQSFEVVVLPGVEKLLANDGAAGDNFGYSASLSADGLTALVGAWSDEDNGHYSGSAYIFERESGTWIERAKLVPPDGRAMDCFGYSVSLSANGSTALVGAYQPGGNDNVGYAYVFERTGETWAEQAKLLASDGGSGDEFGYSVSLSADGSVALVGAYQDGDNGSWSGSAYTFKRSGGAWTETAKLLASDGSTYDQFGSSVSLSANGSTALIGAEQDQGRYRGLSGATGAAYIFEQNGGIWAEKAKLVADDGAEWDDFGHSVSLSADGSTALVGAYRGNDKGSSPGSAYIFARNEGTWIEKAKLVASDGVEWDLFGDSVSLSADGSTAIVGARQYDNDGGSSVGSAYIFRRSGSLWTESAKLVDLDGVADDYFGSSVSLSGNGSTALIGASGDDNDDGDSSGSAVLLPTL